MDTLEHYCTLADAVTVVPGVSYHRPLNKINKPNGATFWGVWGASPGSEVASRNTQDAIAVEEEAATKADPTIVAQAYKRSTNNTIKIHKL